MKSERQESIFENIPEELAQRNQWVAWSGEKRENGKMTKIPINPNTGKFAKVNDPSTWSSFQKAVEYLQSNRLNGIGFVFTGTDPFVGIDLDNCIDNETHGLTPAAASAVKLFGSYTEFSPSGKGLHIIAKGRLPEHGRKQGDIEMYDRDRFFTFTGNIADGTPREVIECQDALLDFHRQYFSSPAGIETATTLKNTHPLDDDNIIQKAMSAANGAKFKRLWVGDHSEYPSQSEADLALCRMLAYWTDGDHQEIDRLFQQSGLFRPKWSESHGSNTYGQMTIDKALSNGIGIHGHSVQTANQPDPEQPKFNLTDLGNAERLVHHHGLDIRYCHIWKSWLIWDGQRWVIDKTDRIKQLAKKVVRSIYTEAEQVSDSSERREIAKHAMRSESNHSLTAMVSRAESEVPISPDMLDKDPWLFNCANGTLDLQLGKLRTHRREDYITKMVPVDYNPEATHHLWDSFLGRVLDGDQDLISFLQRAVGYSLTGLTDEQCLFILHGLGANGKTTFLQAVSEIMDDYAMQTPTETLLVKGKGAIPNDVARLKGARFVTASEAEAEQRLAENLIKQMTGGDKMSARFLHQEYFDFIPTHKLFLGTNHKPVIKGTDHAIWRRIRLIPFEVTIPEDERDTRMPEKLRNEAEGILAWAVEGCRLWRAEGLVMPTAVKEATEGYRSEMDVIAQFVEDCCERGERLTVASHELYKAFTEWCEINGEQPVSKKLLNLRLKEIGFEAASKIGPSKQRGLKGLAICTR